VERELHNVWSVDRGFSLIEVLVASTLMTIALIALAQLSVVSIRMNQVARLTTVTTVLASQKIEQLQALTWAFDAAGAPVSDTTTDTSVAPEQSAGGTGLAPSPAEALVQDTTGYCDFLDARGRPLVHSVGAGTAPPSATAFVRRWSIQTLPTVDGLLIQVSVARRGTHAALSNVHTRPGEARMIVLKTRKSG
jgi:prepilin-type N-terminal cleavage/methylation domain-containing protein